MKTSSWPLVLIALAMAGAGISYHFTLDSRFAAIEQKLDANAVALQQAQIAQETLLSSKTESLGKLSQEVDSLQMTLGPLGKAKQDQTDALAEVRKQIASLQQSAQAQEDAQKKLADYAGQIEKIRHDVQEQAAAKAPATAVAPTPAPAPITPPPTTNVPVPPATTSSASAPATTSNPASTTHASVAMPVPLPPRAESAFDIRPAELTAVPIARATPVALPVNYSASMAR